MVAGAKDWQRSWRVWGPVFLVLLVFVLALVAIHHMLATVKLDDVVAEFKSISPGVVALAIATTALGYLSMVGYDWTALKFIGKKIPFPTIVVGSFTGYALGNTIGLSVVSGGLARYRVYSAHGLDGADVALVSGISAASLGAGVLIVGLGGIIIDPAAIQPVVGVSSELVRWLAAATALVILLVASWLLLRKEKLEFAGHEIPVPPPQLLGTQLICALLDVFFAGLTLYILLPDGVDTSLPVFLVVYAVAVVAAALSHVPGGVGVFEMVIIGALGTSAELDGITSALIAYRIIYFLGPFALALLIIATHEAILRRQKLAGALAGGKQKAGSVASGLSPLAPDALAAMVFLAGLLLVVSGVMPIPHVASDAAGFVLQLVFAEVSTIASGIFGMALILVAFGLRRKVRAAYVISLILLVVGAVSIFVQRGALWPALVLLGAAVILYITRSVFNRDSRLSYHIFSPAWFGLLAMVLFSAAFLGFFVHKDAAYAHETWWQFTFDGHLPRYLRVGTAIAVVAFLSMLSFALQPVRLRIKVDLSEDQHALEELVQDQGQPDAHFVFTSDKSVLLNEENTAFIMYGAHGKYWVALGDPIGEREAFPELIGDFISLAERHNCKAVFYQVSDAYLPDYLDVGFVLSKLGEEAVVPLADFGLEGKSHRSLRAAHNKSVRAGLEFEVIQPPHSAELMERLRAISDDWLADKHVREKSFSLGRFDVDYLQRFPIALVKRGDDIIAFANVLVTEAKEGSTVDLMRHVKDAPNGTMEYLFVELMLTLKEQGYAYFSLGLAPLSGLGGKHIKRTWDRFGMVLYRFGGHFYNFDGLRMFKEKFRPEWHSRYLASGGGVSPLLSLRAVNALIAGSLKGALTK